MIGIVKWFSPDKGYGFIRDQEGKDYFVHYSGINGEGYRNLDEGQEVEFELGESHGRECAVDVTPIAAEVAG